MKRLPGGLVVPEQSHAIDPAGTAAGARCGAAKEGGYRLHCELDAGHDGWHKAACHERREITYLGSHHLYEATETATWEPAEPVDLLKEAVGRLMQTHDANPVATQRIDGEKASDG